MLSVLPLMILRPPISTLLPYTTLFRSLNGVVYIAYGTFSCDQWCSQTEPYHGWVFGYRTADLVLVAADRKSTRLNSSHVEISYAVFCLKKKKWYGTSLVRIDMGWNTCW